MILDLSSITTFVFDMDGVLTDGSLLLDNENNWHRTMNIKDGYALQLAVQKGFNVIVVSGSSCEPVKNRLNKLGVSDIRFSVLNKSEALMELMNLYHLSKENILFMGDDIPDLLASSNCGIFSCPSDAATDVLKNAKWISSFAGGKGAVRDIIEKVLRSQNKWVMVDSISSI